jgi:hypothetical protein
MVRRQWGMFELMAGGPSAVGTQSVDAVEVGRRCCDEGNPAVGVLHPGHGHLMDLQARLPIATSA